MAEFAGQVRAANGLPASGVTFQVLRERVGGDTEVVATLETNESGQFTTADLAIDPTATLVARIPGADGVVLQPLASAQDPADMRLVLPDTHAALDSEFARLTQAVAPTLGDTPLAQVTAGTDRCDLSIIQRQTGWDARLLALSVNSARLAGQGGDGQAATGMSDEAVYGLLRSGLPSDPDLLARVPAAAVSAALDNSATAGVISLDPDARAREVSAFEKFAETQRLASRPGGGVSTLQELLDASGLTVDGGENSPRRLFQKVLLDGTSDQPLWAAAAAAGLGDAAITTLKSQAQLAFLTTNNVALMARVKSDVEQAPNLGEGLTAGGWDKSATWSATLTALGGPDTVPAAYLDDDDPVGAYSAELARRVRVAYPIQAVAAMVRRGDLPLGDGATPDTVATTLLQAGAHGLQLGATNMKTVLADHPDILEGLDAADQASVTSALATLQRVYQLSPSNEAMAVLLDQKLTSAYDIVAMTEPIFLDRYGRLFPSEREARLVYRKSEQVQAVLYTFYSMTKQAADAPVLPTVSGTTEQRQQAVDAIKRVLPETPTMESLFGSMDYCACDHCRSVLGPAAYVVDVLKFLDPDPLIWDGFTADWAKRHRGQQYPYGSPYEELIARRPDLAYLQLSCENTNTELPVIDIVNEILEYLVVAGGTTLSPNAVRDSGALESQDVMAEPEFVVDSAYTRLREATFPSLLPFDLWHETVREFLGWFGEPLAALLDLFPVFDSPPDIAYASAVERLGLTRIAADVLTEADPLTHWWTRLGFGAMAQEADAVNILQRAKELACRLGISYQELTDLLDTHFLNPALDHLGVLTTAGVSVADALVWRTHQNLVALAEPADPTDHDLWSQVQSVRQRLATVTSTYGLDGARTAEEWLLALPDDTLGAVVVLLDPDATCDFDRTLLGSAATGDALTGARLAEIVVKADLFVRLRKATGWSTPDLDAALRAFVPGGTAGTALFGAPMRTALIYLAHVVELSDVLGTDEVARRRWISGWAPLDHRGPASLYSQLFVQRSPGQRNPAFTAPLGDVLSTDAVGADAKLSSYAVTLAGALGVTAGELQAIVDRSGEAWATRPLDLESVSEVHRYAFLAEALGAPVGDVLTLERLSGIAPFTPLAADPLTDGVADQTQLTTMPFVDAAVRFARAGLSIAELDYLVAHRVDPVTDPRPDPDATAALLDGITTKLTEALARLNAAPTDAEPLPDAPPPPTPAEIATSVVAAAMGPRTGVTAALLSDQDHALADPAGPGGAPLVEAFLSLAAGPDRARATNAHLLLSKVLTLVDRFDLSAAECAEFGLTALPVAADDDTDTRFAALLRLIDYAELRKATAAKPDELLAVLEGARGGASSAGAALATATKRRPNVVAATLTALGLTPAALADLTGIRRVWQVLTLIERLGVDAATVTRWCTVADPAISAETRARIAREVKDAVRTHLGSARWRQTAKPISDRLRQRQRDALVATVLHTTGLKSLDELYQWLLIDPGSEPVLRTTRIRQAMSSLQMFVQRCLLNIEPRVHPSTINVDQWEWMKRYRVWEANRKIFLYPENWLEPEFRDDKSHLFTELEAALTQSDVTTDVVEDAFLTYLRKLDEIARLDVVGFYTEQDALDPGSTTLHVIGRTHGQPHQYFYRRLQHDMWTPWEPMGLDIDGDHVVPVVWRDRLHVFWVSFLQKSDDSDSNPKGDTPNFVRQSLGVGVGILVGNSTFQVGGPATTTKKSPELAQATTEDVATQAGKRGVARRIDVALHWSEYLGGTWSPATSGGFGRVPAMSTTAVFDPADVFVHTSTLWDDNTGEEAGVQVHLTGAMTQTFLLRGRNSTVERGTPAARPPIPYNAATAAINRYRGSGTLSVTFAQKFTSVNGGKDTPTSSTLGILAQCGPYSVLPSANGIAVGAGDIGSLVSPFFFADASRTFFVQPSLLETTTETWEEWVVPDPDLGTIFDPNDIGDRIVVPFIPRESLQVPDKINPGNPLLDPWPELTSMGRTDIITSPDVAILFDDTVLGPRGGLDLTVVTPHASKFDGVSDSYLDDVRARGAIPVVSGVGDVVDAAVGPGNGDGLAPDRVVLVDHAALSHAGLATDATKINVVSGAGIFKSRIDTRDLRGFER